MPLDGLRAWIGEVERKLGMRTRVFLALAAIAIGGAGAAIYLALDTRDNAVSESDVRELQENLEAQIGAGGATGVTELAQLEAELNALEAEVEQLRGKDGASSQGPDGAGGVGTSGAGDSGGVGTQGVDDTAGADTPDAGDTGGAGTGGADVLPDVLREAQGDAE